VQQLNVLQASHAALSNLCEIVSTYASQNTGSRILQLFGESRAPSIVPAVNIMHARAQPQTENEARGTVSESAIGTFDARPCNNYKSCVRRPHALAKSGLHLH
jgi:hypothetical protein